VRWHQSVTLFILDYKWFLKSFTVRYAMHHQQHLEAHPLQWLIAENSHFLTSEFQFLGVRSYILHSTKLGRVYFSYSFHSSKLFVASSSLMHVHSTVSLHFKSKWMHDQKSTQGGCESASIRRMPVQVNKEWQRLKSQGFVTVSLKTAYCKC